MCGIFLTFDDKRIPILHEANQTRGSRASTLVDVPVGNSIAHIGHIVAPTGDNSKVNMHPSQRGETKLWHNGVITEPTLRSLGCDIDGWDTACLHQLIDEKGFSALADVDGAFACLYFNGEGLYTFRNEAAPLYLNSDAVELSSASFDSFKVMILPNVVYQILEGGLVHVSSFKNISSPYYFGE
jgi:hypothetical protein